MTRKRRKKATKRQQEVVLDGFLTLSASDRFNSYLEHDDEDEDEADIVHFLFFLSCAFFAPTRS